MSFRFKTDYRDRVLRDVWLVAADLSYQDLRDCDLSGANLRLADLTGADLRGTNLSRCNLQQVRLDRALTGNCIVEQAICDGQVYQAILEADDFAKGNLLLKNRHYPYGDSRYTRRGKAA